jgi:predicted RNA-binding Zn-ribbon protein involved in translation (DUF1610 family)
LNDRYTGAEAVIWIFAGLSTGRDGPIIVFRRQAEVVCWVKTRKREMSKQAMREESERLVKEALERKTLTVKQGKTRIDSKCRKCGALNRVSAAQGQVRVPYTCKECGENQRTF